MPTNNRLTMLILAAGKGKRMNNPDIPKVLAKLSEQPLLYYVLKQTSLLNPTKTIVVVGHKSDLVIDFCNNSEFENIEFAYQEQQLGTGNAVLVAENNLTDADYSVLILAGDVPLLRAKTLSDFIERHNSNKSECSVLSTNAPNPTGYGRIVRDTSGNFQKITEHKDANENELKISEINSGIFLVNSEILFESLKKISNNNTQKEYYLTDIIEIMKNDDRKVFAFDCAEFNELQGINTTEELLKAEDFYYNNYK